VRALQRQLVAVGHRVLLVAPEHNASGSSMRFDWGATSVTRDDGDDAAIGITGSPATAVVLGTTALYPAGRRPDLVVSGINHGPNDGSLLAMSGTVGAAVAGTLLLDPPVPGIAVSAARLDAAVSFDAPANREHLDAVAAHVAWLLSATRGSFCEEGRVVRGRTVLNVNYPGRPVAELAGVKVVHAGRAAGLRIRFEPGPGGTYVPRVESTTAPSAADDDGGSLARGYVTVTPLSGDLEDREAPRSELERRLGPGMAPPAPARGRAAE
jgi:5'-nucleotidase